MRDLGIIFLIIMSFLLVSYDIIPELKKPQRLLVYMLVVIPVSGFLFPVDILTAFICGMVGSILSAIRNYFIKNLKSTNCINKNSKQELNNTVAKTKEIKFDSNNIKIYRFIFAQTVVNPLKMKIVFAQSVGLKSTLLLFKKRY